MAILERQVKHIRPEKQAERAAHGEEIAAIESRHGYPPLRRYIMLFGPDEMGTEVLEREWPSMAAMEQAVQSCQADPEYQTILKLYTGWARDTRIEIYMVAPR
jgi:hypothetical protein